MFILVYDDKQTEKNGDIDHNDEDEDDDNNSKWSKNFDERPYCRLVTPRGGEWIRPTLTPWFLGPHVSSPNGISIGSAVFAYIAAKAPN